ncbi:MAG: cyclic pyranopterin monophosphate synthase MoaC [Polyangia bacterium]|jgi:cyclic pyranopterin phosphate synthase|nr:cyclic pyranopterin monophosphate synthase MoaC [Polyangia bacterium]
MGELTHLDERGQARMVDVGDKPETSRMAVASAAVHTRPDVIEAIRAGSAAKGDVLAVARVAGIMAAKKTAELIPLCHPLRLDKVIVELTLDESAVLVRAEARSTGPTGVEMEALTAASVAALAVYDMCKAMDRRMLITDLCLQEKAGGRSGHFRRDEPVEPGEPTKERSK